MINYPSLAITLKD